MRDVLHEGDETISRLRLGLADLERDPPAIENDETFRNVEDVVNIVPNEKNRTTARADIAHKSKDLFRFCQRQGSRGLIEHD